MVLFLGRRRRQQKRRRSSEIIMLVISLFLYISWIPAESVTKQRWSTILSETRCESESEISITFPPLWQPLPFFVSRYFHVQAINTATNKASPGGGISPASTHFVLCLHSFLSFLPSTILYTATFSPSSCASSPPSSFKIASSLWAFAAPNFLTHSLVGNPTT